MYSTDLRDQFFSEAIPLKPLVCRAGSAQSVTLAVPPAPAIAGLQISTVAVSLTLPDGSVVSADAVAIASTPLWTATFPAGAFSTSGKVTEGFTVALGGKDERGETRVWIVAKGDLEVKSGDATPTPGESYYLVKLRDSAPDDPVEGDAYVSEGELHIFAEGEWVVIGGGAAPFDDEPQMAGTASPGESADYSRGDHVHPHDAAKLDGAAAYSAWEEDPPNPYQGGAIVSHLGEIWQLGEQYAGTDSEPGISEEWDSILLEDLLALKQDALAFDNSPTQNSNNPVKSGGVYTALQAKANATDVATALAQKASFADLPYAMVTPGEWGFGGLSSGMTVDSMEFASGNWELTTTIVGSGVNTFSVAGTQSDLMVVFGTEYGTITATRASLPGHLLDRANNLIDATTGNVTLTLPPFDAGKVRDLLVACTIGLDGNDEPWSVIFQGQGSEAPSGADEISFKAEGDDASTATFPVPDAADDWWYSLTERAPHVFAVSLKQLQSVSQPTQTQGGS